MSVPKIVVVVEDVNRSFARFVKHFPKETRKRLAVPVLVTSSKLADRMIARAPVGPGAEHIKNAITFKQRGLTGYAGFLPEDFGGDPAEEGSDATMAEVGLYNEKAPNKQPFMVPAAEAEAPDFARRIIEALVSMENALAHGGVF